MSVMDLLFIRFGLYLDRSSAVVDITELRQRVKALEFEWSPAVKTRFNKSVVGRDRVTKKPIYSPAPAFWRSQTETSYTKLVFRRPEDNMLQKALADLILIAYSKEIANSKLYDVLSNSQLFQEYVSNDVFL